MLQTSPIHIISVPSCYRVGNVSDKAFVDRTTRLLQEIKKNSNNELGVTLSLGEQTEDSYKRWKDAGAHRYLLRIETSNPELYAKIHPNNPLHSHTTRLRCLESLQRCGYQTGTGVMIGLPFQTITDLANDLLFLQSMDIDMVGMGPYLEHHATPLYEYRHLLFPSRKDCVCPFTWSPPSGFSCRTLTSLPPRPSRPLNLPGEKKHWKSGQTW